MSNEDELRETLDATAKDISRFYNNPRSWLSWILYLLGSLERQATDESSAHKDAYKEMLLALQDAIRNRMKTGSW